VNLIKLVEICRMNKILTITFSPCIDKSTSVQELLPERKLHCALPKLEPGGGGINVARAIKKLGGEAIAIYPSGGYTGKFLNHLVEKEGLTSGVIHTKNETRENITVFEEITSKQYRLGMPSSELFQNEWEEILALVSGCNGVEYIIASGSLPPGVPMDVFGQLAKIAKSKHAKFIVDTSGEPLKHATEVGVFLIKPNLEELAFLSGKKELQSNEIKNIAKEMIASGKCENIVVSMGAKGALLFTSNSAFSFVPPKVTVKSTVGAGDSMVGGILYAISNGKSMPEAVQYGVACGTSATMHAGTELCNKIVADELFGRVEVELL
jgi:6-phosphofructokinase 2